MTDVVYINGESCTLVTDFAELKTGMVVYVVRCGYCAATHRAMLGGHAAGEMLIPGGRAYREGIEMLPLPRCGYRGMPRYLCSGAVASGRVFRVIDGLDAKADERQETIERAKEMLADMRRWQDARQKATR